MLPSDLAISYDLTGPNLRGSGLAARPAQGRALLRLRELRVRRSASGRASHGPVGSCFDRNWVRALEMAESAKILHQALDALEKMEKADVHEKVPEAREARQGRGLRAERGAARAARLLHRGRRHRA